MRDAQMNKRGKGGGARESLLLRISQLSAEDIVK